MALLRKTKPLPAPRSSTNARDNRDFPAKKNDPEPDYKELTALELRCIASKLGLVPDRLASELQGLLFSRPSPVPLCSSSDFLAPS